MPKDSNVVYGHLHSPARIDSIVNTLVKNNFMNIFIKKLKKSKCLKQRVWKKSERA